MTVSSTTTKNSYSGNGSTTVFAYGFKVFDEDDLTVILRTDATGAEAVQSITTNYTVSGVGNTSGGNVTFVTAPASGITVVIRRSSPLTQTTDYTPNDPFPAASHEDALDNLTFIAQQQQEELDRAIKLSRTNTMTSTEFTVGATDRANKVLAFDSSGEISVTQELGTFKGNSATTTTAAFVQRDIVKSTTTAQLNNVYICVADSAIGDLLTDTNHWALLVDAVSAATSATAAAASAAAASTSETNAAASATAAAASEAGVAADAAAAETAKLAAQAAQTAAETAETNAETAETNAETAETNAAASQVAAASSASSASSSASTATTKAAEASTSATNAATSATTATTQASTATTKASEAATSATNAASSASSASSAQTAAESARDATLAAYDNFDDRYLGTKSSAPTVDNDGDALVAGALYFDSVAGAMYVYTGSAWVAAYVSGTGFLALTGGTMSGDINFGDNDKAIFGAGSDLAIYHDGGNSQIYDSGTGNLNLTTNGTAINLIGNNGNEYMAIFTSNGASTLYHDNAPKFATSSTGCTITGTVTADVLSLADDDASHAIKLQAPASVTATTTFTLPDGDGASGQTMITDGAGALSWAAPYGNRNLIINGSKVIDQRNGGSSVSVAGGTTKALADRWKADIAGGVDGVFSAQQQTSVVPTGFQYATKLTVTTVHSTSGNAHYYRYYYAGIEGYDTNQLELGTSNAKTVTISFYVRSSVTGTYCVGLQNASFNRAYSAEYSISSADTWERKEVTIALDQTGTWNSTNGIGLKLFWDLGSGSNWNMTADTWAATNTWKTSNQTAWIENASATFYITGAQLEVGSATPFDHSESYSETLAKCQRYYYESQPTTSYGMQGIGAVFDGDSSDIVVYFPTTMRTKPTFTFSNLAIFVGASGQAVTSAADAGSTTNASFIRTTYSSAFTVGQAAVLLNNNNVDGYARFDAEL